MTYTKLAIVLFITIPSHFLTACGGEQMEPQAPRIVVNVPPIPPPEIKVVVTTSKPCGGICGPRTRCDAMTDKCVPEEEPAQQLPPPSELTIDLINSTSEHVYTPGSRYTTPFAQFRVRPGAQPAHLSAMVIEVGGPLNGPFWNVYLAKSVGGTPTQVSDIVEAPDMGYRMEFSLNVEVTAVEDFYLIGAVPDSMFIGEYTLTIGFGAKGVDGRTVAVRNNIPPMHFRVGGPDPCLWDNEPPAWLEQLSTMMEPSFSANERRIVVTEFAVTACRPYNVAGFDFNLTHQDGSIPDTSNEADGTGLLNDQGALYRNLSITTPAGAVLFGPAQYPANVRDRGYIPVALRGQPYTMNTGDRVVMRLEADVVRGTDDPEWQRSFFYLWKSYTDTGSDVEPFIPGYGAGNQPIRQMIRLVR